MQLTRGTLSRPIGWLLWIEAGKVRSQPVRGWLRIGRSDDCELVVEDRFVSARHCELRDCGGDLRIFDLGSKNGLYVNERRVYTQLLADNDVIRVGRHCFCIRMTH